MTSAGVIAASPEEVGVKSAALEELFAFVEREVDEGRLPAAHVAIGRHGRIAGARAFGRAVQGGERKPATDQTLFCLYSSTKAVAGVGIWALVDDGKLRLDERVAEIVPELAGQGKDAVTVEQLMLFIGGFPQAPMHPRLWEDRQARLERIKGWRLNWEPGSRFEYHPTAAHWVMVEIMTNRTGLDFRDYLRQRLLDPMGAKDLFVGLPDSEHARAADVEYMVPPVATPGAEVNPETILHFNLPSQRRAGCPGGGGFSTAADLALFYQVLVNGGSTADGTRVLRPETVEMATTVRTDPVKHRDAVNDIPVNRGLAVVVAGDDGNAELRGFGRGASPRAFGHGGAGGQIGWGDPESGISVGFVTNGFRGEQEIRARGRTISTLAAACA
jgi:CubicO group peptidase (beta-lactamase class C family)